MKTTARKAFAKPREISALAASDESETDEDVPADVQRFVSEYIQKYSAAHNRHLPPVHPFAGTSSERQSVGDAGHCWVCEVVGHVRAHPEAGCPDVGCDRDHSVSEWQRAKAIERDMGLTPPDRKPVK